MKRNEKVTTDLKKYNFAITRKEAVFIFHIWFYTNPSF